MSQQPQAMEESSAYRETVTLKAVLKDVRRFDGKAYVHLLLEVDGRQFTAITAEARAITMYVGGSYTVNGEMRFIKQRYVMGWPVITDIPDTINAPKTKRKRRILKPVLIAGAILFGLGALGSSNSVPTTSSAPAKQPASITNQAQQTTADTLSTATSAEPTVNVPTTATQASTVPSNSTSTPKAAAPVKQNTVKTYTPNDCDIQSIPFSSTTTTSSAMDAGTSRITTYGINGSKKICYPSGRSAAAITTVTSQPTTQVTTNGTRVAASTPSYSGYTNVNGNYVPSPSTSGATTGGYSPTFRCNDGTYSYAQNSRGACSSHGGIGTRL